MARGGGSPRPVDVAIRDAGIELGSLLKLAQVVSSGGEAKALIQAGEVRVNGAVETRRRHVLVPGDLVGLPGGRTLRVTTGAHTPS